MILGTILVLAALVRVLAIGSPPRLILDEYWYARDGCFYWRGSAAECGMAGLMAPDRDVSAMLAEYGELTPEHPPLGKWLVGAPMEVTGFTARAWRLAPLVAGVLSIALLYLLVKRSLKSTAAAAGAATLLAVDFPHFVHSRLAMLDIFVGMFALAAFLFALLDREQLRARAAGGPAHHRWRFAAGVAGGAAAACKISGAAVVIAVFALITAWEFGARRRSARPSGSTVRLVVPLLLSLAVVPLIVYLATYAGRLDGTLLTGPWADDSWLRAWVERQSYMLDFHAAKPGGGSEPWDLPMTEPAVPYVLQSDQDGIREILLFGNPVLWWGAFGAVVYAAWHWCRCRQAAAAVVALAFIATYAAWLSSTLTGRTVYLFHAIPITPVLYLALAYAYVTLATSRPRRIAALGIVVAAVGAFLFYLPILSARPLDRAAWRLRACSAQALWLDPVTDCGLTTEAGPAAPSAVRR